MTKMCYNYITHRANCLAQENFVPFGGGTMVDIVITYPDCGVVRIDMHPGRGLSKNHKRIFEILDKATAHKRISGYGAKMFQQGIIILYYNLTIANSKQMAAYVAEEIADVYRSNA